MGTGKKTIVALLAAVIAVAVAAVAEVYVTPHVMALFM